MLGELDGENEAPAADRFKDQIEYRGAPSPVLSLLVIWLVFQTTIMVYFLMLKEYVDITLSITDIFVYVMSIAAVMLIVWLINIVIGVSIVIYWNIKAQ